MKNYDKKVKQTRIFLEDYLRLKGFAQRAGVSMAEALHKLITGQALKAPAAVRHIQRPMSIIMAEAVAPAYQVSSKSVIATNGSKAAAFRIKAKGVRYA
ncbi:hypothetical protein ES703_120707 [subsurface metagenome]